MQVVIFSSPGRSKMISKLKTELKEYDIHVLADPITFGKKKFWIRWEQARQICVNSKHDFYLIIPDDISNLDLKMIRTLKNNFTNRLFSCNILNDGRTSCWNSQYSSKNDFTHNNYRFFNFGFVDCGIATNRATLSRITIDKVPDMWFDRPTKSSGVGYQLTRKFQLIGCPMYMPYPSIADHGNHNSVMHPIERKNKPLIAKRT